MGAMILVTGAGGFLGREVVAAALARGHAVRAVQRRDGPLPAGAEGVVADLGHDDLWPVMQGVGTVIHCAASLAGQGDTEQATARVIEAAGERGFVLVSSMSVYGAGAPGSRVDEATPLEPLPQLRDAYCRMKLAQEARLRAARPAAWIARPGVIYGPDRLWNAHLGATLGPVLLQAAGGGVIPLIHVADCARALVLMAETTPEGIEVVNMVADDLPGRGAYLAALDHAPALRIPVHWRLWDMLALLAGPVAANLPGLLRRPVVRARLMPLTYANDRLRDRLGWRQEVSFKAGMRRAQQGSA
jgi:nucleoside-diphosphate-sugar epimerase